MVIIGYQEQIEYVLAQAISRPKEDKLHMARKMFNPYIYLYVFTVRPRKLDNTYMSQLNINIKTGELRGLDQWS